MAKLMQGITREEYLKTEGMNQSKAKYAIKSAWHYYKKWDDPDRPDSGSTDYMMRGSLAHEIAIEGDDRLMVFEGRRAGKKWEDFKDECADEGKVPVTAETGVLNARDIRGMAASAKEAMVELGIDGDPECCVTFELYGQTCKALIDKLDTDSTVHDLKFTDAILPHKFSQKVREFDYDFQIAWYCEGVRQAMGMEIMPNHQFLTVEPKYPWEWSVHILSEESLRFARNHVKTAMENLEQANRTGDWSHPAREVNVIVPPFYAYEEEGEYPGAVNEQ